MSNTATAAEANLRGAIANRETTIGDRVDALIANPLAVVGIGILAGYLLACLLRR